MVSPTEQVTNSTCQPSWRWRLVFANQLRRTLSGRSADARRTPAWFDGTSVRLGLHRNMSWSMWSTLMLCGGFTISLVVFVLEHR